MIDEERQTHSGRGYRRRRLHTDPRVLVPGVRLQGIVRATVPGVAAKPFGTHSPIVFEGVLTKTVEDAALGLTALAGYDSGDPSPSICAVTSSALCAAWSRACAAYNPNMDVFPVEADVAAYKSLAAAKRTTPCLARAQCSSSSSRGRPYSRCAERPM
jgi:hypothetical protein